MVEARLRARKLEGPISLAEAYAWMEQWEDAGAGYASFRVNDEEVHYLEDAAEELGDTIEAEFYYAVPFDAMNVLEHYFDEDLDRIDQIPEDAIEQLQEALDTVVRRARMYETAIGIKIALTPEDRQYYKGDDE